MPKRGGKKGRSKSTSAKIELDKAMANLDLHSSQAQSSQPKKTFLDLPREIRDKIYEEALVLRPTREVQKELEKIAAAPPADSFERGMHEDYLRRPTQIVPFRVGGYYKQIQDALGLLLVNKQIHEEAAHIEFSKNQFVVPVYHDDPHCFWWNPNSDAGPNRPGAFHFDKFKLIKHIAIHVVFDVKLDVKVMKPAIHKIGFKLHQVVKNFLEAGNKLDTIHIRFMSSLGGQIESVRDQLMKPGSSLPIKDTFGDVVQVQFRDLVLMDNLAEHVFEPFKKLDPKPQVVTIWGDLSRVCIDKLESGIRSNAPNAKTVRKRAEETKNAEARAKANKSLPKPGLAGFLEMLIAKDPDYPENAAYRRMAKQSEQFQKLSPALKQELFGPLSEMQSMGGASSGSRG